MSILKPAAIKIIAQAIADGHSCYVHKHSAKIFIVDHTTEDAKQIIAQEQKQVEIEKKIENYLKIEKLSADDQLVMMKDFLEEVTDRSVRKQLSNALSRKNPLRNFTQAIESDIELAIHWKNYQKVAYQRWVSNFVIDAYNF